jgi:hypothetical protein
MFSVTEGRQGNYFFVVQTKVRKPNSIFRDEIKCFTYFLADEVFK